MCKTSLVKVEGSLPSACNTETVTQYLNEISDSGSLLSFYSEYNVTSFEHSKICHPILKRKVSAVGVAEVEILIFLSNCFR